MKLFVTGLDFTYFRPLVSLLKSANRAAFRATQKIEKIQTLQKALEEREKVGDIPGIMDNYRELERLELKEENELSMVAQIEEKIGLEQVKFENHEIQKLQEVIQTYKRIAPSGSTAVYEQELKKLSIQKKKKKSALQRERVMEMDVYRDWAKLIKYIAYRSDEGVDRALRGILKQEIPLIRRERAEIKDFDRVAKKFEDLTNELQHVHDPKKQEIMRQKIQNLPLINFVEEFLKTIKMTERAIETAIHKESILNMHLINWVINNRVVINRLKEEGLPLQYMNELIKLQTNLENKIHEKIRDLYLRATYVMKRAA